MESYSWMEAAGRAVEHLRDGWPVKLLTTGLLAEGVLHAELISLFAMVVLIDLVTKWIALARGYLMAKGETELDLVFCILAIPAAHRAGVISSRRMKVQFCGKIGVYILLTAGGGIVDQMLQSVGRPDIFMSMCVSYLAASEMMSIVENLEEAGVHVPDGLRKRK